MIELIKDVNKLEETCYFELLPGTYKDKCWNEESIFFTEEDWDYLSPIVRKYVNNYDHYSFMSVDKMSWREIIKELNRWKETLKKAKNIDELTGQTGFFFRDSQENFAKNFEESKNELMKMIDDFVLWLQETLKYQNKIAVLGI